MFSNIVDVDLIEALAKDTRERSFDQGVTWLVVESLTANSEKRADDPGAGVYWRFECTSYSSGTLAYRMSR